MISKRVKVFVDVETWSLYDLKIVGPRKYFTAPDAGVHCIAYKINNQPTKLWLPPLKPPKVFTDPKTIAECDYYAFNAEFELAFFEVFAHGRMGWPRIPDDQWYCTQTDARACGLPDSLGGVGEMLDIKLKKDHVKGSVIKKPGICKPKKPTKTHPYRFHRKDERPKLFEQMYEYCIRDVDAEHEIHHKLPRHITAIEPERTYYLNTVKINRRGLPMDINSVEQINDRVLQYKDILNEELNRITGGQVTAATQVTALQTFLNDKHHLTLDNLRAETVRDAILDQSISTAARRCLEIRKDVSATSTAKYARMLQAYHEDGTIKNHLVFYGAGATGRFSAKGAFQSQNMAKPCKSFQTWTDEGSNTSGPLTAAWSWSHGEIELFFGGYVQLAKDLLRTMIAAPKGSKFLCGDFSSVEARGVAWQCKEEEVLEAYRKGLDFYKVIAADMYKVDYSSVNSEQRSAGKIAVLACGFQGGKAALISMANKYGINFSEEEAQDIVDRFRSARPKLVRTWKTFQKAAMLAVKNPGKRVKVTSNQPVVFQVRGEYLFMKMPSGRELCYYQPREETVIAPWGDPIKAVVVWRKNHTNHKWWRQGISGGNLFQNCVQATCRDILLFSQDRLDKEGYQIILSVHDECVAQVPDSPEYTLSYFLKKMAEGPGWADGFPIGADGWEGRVYHKGG